MHSLRATYFLLHLGCGEPIRAERCAVGADQDTLAGSLEHVGRMAADNRQFVDGVFWVLRSGARWHDLPERYGKRKSVPTRFMRWARTACGNGSSQT